MELDWLCLRQVSVHVFSIFNLGIPTQWCCVARTDDFSIMYRNQEHFYYTMWRVHTSKQEKQALLFHILVCENRSPSFIVDFTAYPCIYPVYLRRWTLLSMKTRPRANRAQRNVRAPISRMWGYCDKFEGRYSTRTWSADDIASAFVIQQYWDKLVLTFMLMSWGREFINTQFS